MKACEVLNNRMQPIREKIKDDKWETVVSACHKEGVNLAAHYVCVKCYQTKKL